MSLTRREMIEAGGGLFFAVLLARPAFAVGPSVEIEMRGKDDGAHVWFDPWGVRIEPGQTVRWTNHDPANAHTTTSYHPDVFDRPLRIPAGAKPWNSDYLLPGQSFAVTLTVSGVYDYYCVPHEHAGMVGRIVVGTPPQAAAVAVDPTLTPLPDIALNGFPDVEDIIAKGVIHRS